MECEISGITTFLSIPSKAEAPIAYSFFPGKVSGPSGSEGGELLVVFVNGLGLPAAAWEPAIAALQADESCPAMLTYDRYGQGKTLSQDPLDGTPGKENGHNFLDVVTDLREIIEVIAVSHLGLQWGQVDEGKLRLLFVGASIGGPICRLYVQHFPEGVEGLVVLDSNICNVNYSDIMPDPGATDFDPSTVIAPDCTLYQYIAARAALVAMFDLSVKNAENLDRTKGPALLPFADEPKLKGLWMSVVGHDPVTFIEGSWERMGTPRSVTERFLQPYWERYNSELVKTVDEGRCEGVVIARGCGHFIQQDDPAFVAGEILKMLKRIG